MPARVGRAPAWIAVIGLIAVGFAAAANFWNNREIEPAVTVAAPAVAIEEPAKEIETQTAASVPTQAASVPAPTVATPAPRARPHPLHPHQLRSPTRSLHPSRAVSVSAAPSEDTVNSENAASVETSPPAAEEPAVVEEPQPAASLGADEARVVIAEDALELRRYCATPPEQLEEAAIGSFRFAACGTSGSPSRPAEAERRAARDGH